MDTIEVLLIKSILRALGLKAPLQTNYDKPLCPLSQATLST